MESLVSTNSPATTATSSRPGRPTSVTITEADHGFLTPCWRWNGAKTPAGYPMMNRREFRGYAHRHEFIKKYGPIPEGMQLDHLCLVRDCVNPDHLEIVSPSENVRRSAVAKLSAREAQMIRAAWADRKSNPVTQKELSERFGVSQPQISHIVTRQQWN